MQNEPLVLTADAMSGEVVTLSRDTPMRDAAWLLRHAGLGEAPVVDEDGRCVGTLSATSFVRWAVDGCPDAVDEPAACRFQVKGRLLTGEDAVICTLAEGSCPLQLSQPTTGGRHTLVCRDPRGIVNDWQQAHEASSVGRVSGYLNADVVTTTPTAPLAELARRMIEAHAHRAFVLDEHRRPVGVVACTDLLAAALDGPPLAEAAEPH